MESIIGRMSKGIDIYSPKILLNDLEMLSLDQKNRVRDKCSISLRKKICEVLEDGIKLKELRLNKKLGYADINVKSFNSCIILYCFFNIRKNIFIF